jgi:hypothetical protein
MEMDSLNFQCPSWDRCFLRSKQATTIVVPIGELVELPNPVALPLVDDDVPNGVVVVDEFAKPPPNGFAEDEDENGPDDAVLKNPVICCPDRLS